MQPRQRPCLPISCLLALLFAVAAPVRAQQPAAESPEKATSPKATAEQITFFEREVRPLLVAKCFKCHGAAKQQGSLRLDSRAAILTGGDLGPAAEPGDPAASRLIEVVEYKGDLRMPPAGKLSDREIASLTRWVKDGMAWPAGDSNPSVPGAKPADEKTPRPIPWSFQPVTDPPAPQTVDDKWSRSPLDQFVFAKLTANNLKPAPAAEKRALLRRAKFDLLGIPPTPAEIEAFLADASPDAFAHAVDRFLSMPEYGQRWGRHWLDVARYADSNGQDENLAYINAFRYRDYVVDAFNQDKPYDQFVREQIAGDLLPESATAGASSNDPFARLVATGFLTLGPKMLAEDDPVKMEMDIVDEQVDAIGGAFLGLTLGCARCHDHKFDPVSTADYYAVAGILKSTRTMDNFKVVAQWHERPLGTGAEIAERADHAARVAACHC
jgi:cytochrome c553